MTLPCEAVLLDVDGALADSTPAAGTGGPANWAAEYGIDPDEFLAGAHGRRTVDRVADFLPPDQAQEAPGVLRGRPAQR